jgi:hypothetical protein
MPSITDQEKLLRDFVLEFVSKGPTARGWEGAYLKCPLCGYYVLKGRGYDKCRCGNITIDSDMLRVHIGNSLESDVETFNAKRRAMG